MSYEYNDQDKQNNKLKNESRGHDSLKINARAILGLRFYFGRVVGKVLVAVTKCLLCLLSNLDKVGTHQEL